MLKVLTHYDNKRPVLSHRRVSVKCDCCGAVTPETTQNAYAQIDEWTRNELKGTDGWERRLVGNVLKDFCPNC